jgi:hypothetical protein
MGAFNSCVRTLANRTAGPRAGSVHVAPYGAVNAGRIGSPDAQVQSLRRSVDGSLMLPYSPASGSASRSEGARSG